MKLNYNELLMNKLLALQNELGISNFNFVVDSEQAFLKKKDIQPGTIYVLTRMLQNDISVDMITQPVQIMILSEQDSLDIAKAFFNEFAKKYNFEAISLQDDTSNLWVKQQYSDPVVLSNFNTVEYGYRSVLYVSATLYISENVLDITDLQIDGNPVKAINVNISYSMSTNTQQLASEFISSSIKTVSTFAMTMTVPVLKNDFVVKCLSILAEIDNTNNTGLDVSERIAYTGNDDFVISFKLAVNDKTDAFNIPMTKHMKLISAQLITAPNQVPSLQLGFIKQYGRWQDLYYRN